MSEPEAKPLPLRVRRAAERLKARDRAARLLEAKVGRTPLRLITSKDMRFGPLVRRLSTKIGTLREILDDSTLRPNLKPEQLLGIAHELIVSIQRARSMSLSEEIVDVVNAESNNDGVILRLGLLEQHDMTLQEAGEAMGVTRERVRQKQAKLEARFSDSKPYTPVLDRSLRAFLEVMGDEVWPVDELSAELARRGILQAHEHVLQIVRFARLKGVQLYVVLDYRGHRLICSEHKRDQFLYFVRVVDETLDRMTKEFGAIPLESLKDELRELGHEEMFPALPLVLTILREDIDWIEPDTWLRAKRAWNRLGNFARKVIAVAPSIQATNLRKGLQRHHRIKFVPPAKILAKMLVKDLPDMALRYDGNQIVAQNRPSVELELTPLEFAVYEPLHKNGGVMDRPDLEAAVRAKGVPHGSFYVTIGYSPIIDRLARGVYAVRGAMVSPGVVEALAAKANVPRTTLARDYGHLRDGRVFLAQQLSQFSAESGFFGRPAGLREYVPDGNYSLVVEGRRTPYEVRCSSEQIRFSARTFATYGAEAGDFVLIIFDLSKSEAELWVGDQDVVDKLSVPTEAEG